MLNAIPVIGWIISFILSASMAVPFWVVYTCCGIGEKYFSFLPSVYHAPGFWDCVGLAIVCSIIKSVIMPSQTISASSDK